MVLTHKLRLREKLRYLYTRYNLFRFRMYKYFIGFDLANQFLRNVDKDSLQLILRKHGATIGRDCDIETGLTFHNCKDYSNLIVGNNCHIGKNCFFDLRDKIIIGNNVVISMQTTFITHIDMTKSPLSKRYPAASKRIIVEDNAYIGAGTTILMGVKLGQGAFVAARSLVLKDVDRNIMVAGAPAKKIKSIDGIKKTD